jgi:hypothetical protein
MCVRAEQAVDQYTHTGGRLMYLGANGFYWHVAFPDGVTHCQPPRRANETPSMYDTQRMRMACPYREG